MKYCLLLLFCLSITSIVRSQDTIIKRNSDILIVKVIEVNPTEIKYKKFDFQDGPTYTELKSNVKIIRYKSGLKEEFSEKAVIVERPSNTDVYNNQPAFSNDIEQIGTRFQYKGIMLNETMLHSLLLKSNDKRITGLVAESKQARAMQFIGFASIPLGIAGLYCLSTSETQTYNYTNGTYSNNPQKQIYQNVGILCGMLAVTCQVESVFSKIKRVKSNKEAVRLYNEKY
jgi:hypothetical protein